MRVLSVDWDYFFPNISWYDWGHRESRFFIEHSWYLRCGNRHLMTGERAVDYVKPDKSLLHNFWSRTVDLIPAALLIAESHTTLYHWLKEWYVDEIVNFDQHHDLGYPSAKGQMDCSNWAGKMLKEGRLKRYTLVYPPWRKNKKEQESRVPKKGSNVNILFDKNDIGKTYYDAIFICRSGAWTPSWYDAEFRKFVMFWFETSLWKNAEFSAYDPLTNERKPTLSEARKLADEYEKNMADLKSFQKLQKEHEGKKEEPE